MQTITDVGEFSRSQVNALLLHLRALLLEVNEVLLMNPAPPRSTEEASGLLFVKLALWVASGARRRLAAP